MSHFEELKPGAELVDVTFVTDVAAGLCEAVDEGRHLLVSLEGRLRALENCDHHSFLWEVCHSDVDPRKPLPQHDVEALLRELVNLSVVLNSHVKPFYCWPRRLKLMRAIVESLTFADAGEQHLLHFAAYENASAEPVPLTWLNLLDRETEFLKNIEQRKKFNMALTQYVGALIALCNISPHRVRALEMLESMLLTFVYRCHKNEFYWVLYSRCLRLLYEPAVVQEKLATHEENIQAMFN